MSARKQCNKILNRIGIRHGTYSSNHLDLLYEQISEKYEFAEIFQRVLDVKEADKRTEDASIFLFAAKPEMNFVELTLYGTM